MDASRRVLFFMFLYFAHSLSGAVEHIHRANWTGESSRCAMKGVSCMCVDALVLCGCWHPFFSLFYWYTWHAQIAHFERNSTFWPFLRSTIRGVVSNKQTILSSELLWNLWINRFQADGLTPSGGVYAAAASSYPVQIFLIQPELYKFPIIFQTNWTSSAGWLFFSRCQRGWSATTRVTG